MSQVYILNSAIFPPGSVVQTIEGNSGGPVPPNGANNIFIIGTNPIDVSGNIATNTLTVSVASATTTQIGVVELATNSQVIAGTDTTDVVVPSSLTAKLGTQTTNGIAYGTGISNPIGWTSAGTDGQIILGNTLNPPAFHTATAGVGLSLTANATTFEYALNGTLTNTYTLVNTTPYVVLSTDQYLGVDSSGGAISVQLPNAPATGRTFSIKDRTGSAAANNITVTTVGGVVNIDGATSFVMNTNYESINVIFNGTSYEVW